MLNYTRYIPPLLSAYYYITRVQWRAAARRPAQLQCAQQGVPASGYAGSGRVGQPACHALRFSRQQQLQPKFYCKSVHALQVSTTSYVPCAVAVDLLSRKIATYEHFNATFPGFGGKRHLTSLQQSLTSHFEGFMPWVVIVSDGVEPDAPFWSSQVPALDNGASHYLTTTYM